jgi:hypothetical protein
MLGHIIAYGDTTQWDGETCLAFPPLAEVDDFYAVIFRIDEAPFMDNEPRIIYATGNTGQDLIKPCELYMFASLMPELEKEVCGCITAGHSNPCILKGYNRFLCDQERTAFIPEGCSRIQQFISIPEQQIGIKREFGDRVGSGKGQGI